MKLYDHIISGITRHKILKETAKMINKLCVGMFGTCGTKEQSPWRSEFRKEYEGLDISFFDPQKDDWVPEDAIVEADHLAEDLVILFPVTSMTYGLGSISEVGFSILQAIKLDDRRDFIIKIDNFLDPSLNDEVLIKESMRGRVLVIKHLEKLRLDNVYVVDDLQQMLNLSIELYWIAEKRQRFAKFNPHRNH
jgi:hypothetical protein